MHVILHLLNDSQWQRHHSLTMAYLHYWEQVSQKLEMVVITKTCSCSVNTDMCNAATWCIPQDVLCNATAELIYKQLFKTSIDRYCSSFTEY